MATKPQHKARYKRLPGLLRRWREEAGLTQRDIAQKVNLSHVAVHKNETAERRVDVAEFCDWATACGVDPVDAIAEFVGRAK